MNLAPYHTGNHGWRSGCSKTIRRTFTALSFRNLRAFVKIFRLMTTAEPLTEEQEVFLKHIQKKGLKRTSQRDLILDVFLRTEEHLSNEDLYSSSKKKIRPSGRRQFIARSNCSPKRD